MQKIIIQNPSDASQRLDKFLKKFLPNAPLGALYKMLRTGKIKVSGKKKDQTYRLVEGDEIDFFLSDEEIKAFQQKTEISKHWCDISKKSRWISVKNLEILYRDEDILIINKPAGLNVHPGDHKTKEASLIEMVHDMLGNSYNSLTFKPALLHRIDRDTSGCIIIALQKNILEKLLYELQNHNIEKIYHAVVIGKMKKPRGMIDDKLLRNESAKNEAKVTVSEQGQRAITRYQTLREIVREEWIFSLLECRIETGRTHQIRVHLAHHHCPILGDKAYGDKKMNSFQARNNHISRQLLHAYSLEFFHPWLGKKIKVEAPYKDDMKNFLQK